MTFTDNGDGTGTLSGTPAAGTAGSYPVTLTATNGVGSAAHQTFTLTVTQGPAITSANSDLVAAGTSFQFTVTTSGSPPPSLSESGPLPNGVTFTDNGNGTASLAGAPAAGTEGSYPLTITADNGVGSPAQQSFTLQVGDAPSVTSSASTTFTVGTQGTFQVTTSGSPTPTVATSGSLPSGVTFTDNGDGTATLSGTPATGTGGTYPLQLTASNGLGSSSQSFTLTVDEAPAFTSQPSATFTLGQQGSFTVRTRGFPAPAITKHHAPPAGLTFVDNGNGTATLSGTPTKGGTTTMSLTASNGSGQASQSLVIQVNSPPKLKVKVKKAAHVGQQLSWPITATGSPTPSISESGALPSGVTFTDHGNGSATIGGTPASGTQGVYHLSVTATNSVGHTTTNLTLTVKT